MHGNNNKTGLRAWLCAASLAVLPAACANAAPEAAPPGGSGDVVATVNGTAITTGELETALGARLASLEEQVFTLKKEQLEAMIAERLLAAEAGRRGISVEALQEQEIGARVEPVTDADIDQFVKANAARLPPDTTALRPRIRAYLANERLEKRRDAYVASLRSAAAVDVRLAPPKIYRASVGADGPSRGPEDARVTVVEFSDFHCPYCRAVQPTLNALLARYPNDVRLVYRHLPLDQLHPQARRASEASWCADRQGKFWAFHDALYAGGADASAATLARLAGNAGLDAGVFEACLASGQAAAAVEKDVEEATRHGLTGTPGFFVNGRPLTGNQPLEAFVAVVEQEIGQAR
jgi:protein-disulfide isomerase